MPPVLDVLRAYLLVTVLAMQLLLLVFMTPTFFKFVNIISLILTDFNRWDFRRLEFYHVR